ncbi:MAG: SRPBCC domain-containing protein [Acidobacteriota bacterium]|nr:SRPBCC domain-containing protein [Acidobacteriota bacterium]
MFRVRAEFREDFVIAASVERVRAFFADLQNFARLMPGVEGISEAGANAARWDVRVDVALVGRMRGEFALVLRDDTPLRIEWGPAEDEKENLLRYAIGLEEEEASKAPVRFALRVELRRERASDLHLMAGLLGERRISEGIQEDVELMVRTFLTRARKTLEA